MPEYLDHFWDINEVNWVKFDLATLQGYAIMLFAFNAVTNIFIVRVELTNAVERRMKKVLFSDYLLIC